MLWKPLVVCASAALASCAGITDRGKFNLTDDQITRALGRDPADWDAEARAQAADPYFLAMASIYGHATCRLIERNKARCRYGESRLILRPGRKRTWWMKTAIFVRDERGWWLDH